MIDASTLRKLDEVLLATTAQCGCVQDSLDENSTFTFWESAALIKSNGDSRISREQQRQIDSTLEQTQQDLQRLRSFAEAKPVPIVAVCGLLNSGKTSLVAGFLSEQGRKRVLVGGADEAGTHRFVLWMPESWRRNTLLWSSLLQQLQQVFGQPAEILSESPAEAHRQYNGSSIVRTTTSDSQAIFSTPLVATDPMLDELQLGLMDCPDIQSGIFRLNAMGESQESIDAPRSDHQSRQFESVADERAKILMNGLRVVSGLIMVVQSNMIGDRTIEQLAESAAVLLPDVKKFIAVNRVPKRYEPNDIAQEIKLHFRNIDFADQYMAYDFRGPDQQHKLPPRPKQWERHSDDECRLPVFYSTKNTQSSSSSSGNYAYLLDLGANLEGNHLVNDSIQSTIKRVERGLIETKNLIDKAIQHSQARSSRLYQVFGEAILRFSSSTGSDSSVVRLQISKEIIDQMRASLERTAPWWAKPSQVIGRWSASAAESAKSWTKSIPGLPAVGEKMSSTAAWVREKFRSGEAGSIMTPERLALAYRSADRHGDLPAAQVENDAVVKASSRVIQRFQTESHARLNDVALDECTALLWRQMSWKQKLYTSAAPATLIFAPILAALTIPFDFGTSHVLLFATVKELLVAGVASAGIFLLQSDQFPELAEGQAAWKQLSDLFALSCDEFRQPRPQSSQLPQLRLGREVKQILPSTTSIGCSNDSDLMPSIHYQADFEFRFREAIKMLQTAYDVA